VRLISINEKTHSKKIYEKRKTLEQNLQIVCLDKEIVELGFNKEFLREKLIEFDKKIGINAVWQGNLTENFKKWLRGEKIYPRLNKERISFFLSKQKKKNWSDFIEENEHLTTFSRLIRVAVDNYIQNHPNSSFPLTNMNDRDLPRIYFEHKESLTAIKGLTQLLLKEYYEELSNQVVNIIEDINEQCQILESKISNDQGGENFDVLLIEDEDSPASFFKTLFVLKGYSYKIVRTGQGGLNQLKESKPKLVLLDIMLPDIDGFEVCKQIKSNNNLKNIPVYYETALHPDQVKNRIEETGADGVLLKPFELSDITKVLDSIV
jgi:twitching motility two-component system response regulator PilG